MEPISEHTFLPARRRKRHWSNETKIALLKEAKLSSVSAVARAHDIQPSLLFTWRAEFGATDSCVPNTSDRASLGRFYKQLLGQIDTLGTEAGAQITKAFLADLKAGRISTLNAANGYSALVSAFCRLQAQAIELAEKLTALPPAPDPVQTAKERELNDRVRRLSEKALMALVSQEHTQGESNDD